MKKIFLHLRNFLLFLKALVSIMRYGRRNKVPQTPPKKILVVQLAKLGDMVCITPVLHAIRKNLPTTKIYVLGNALNEHVLKDNPDYDEYVVFQKDSLSKIVRYLRDQEIDVACIRGIGFIGLIIVLFAGIKTVITSRVVEGKGFETRTYTWLLPYVITIPLRFGEYMPRQFLRLLEPLGIVSSDTEKHLGYSNEAEISVLNFFEHNKLDPQTDFIIGISPSAGHKIKEWPLEKFAKVVTYLTDVRHHKVLLIGGRDDVVKIENVINLLPSTQGVVSTQGMFSIDELKACMSKLSLFISVDTGPVYIAEAFKIPTIDITGPIDEREQPPISEIHRVVIPAIRTTPQLFVMNAKSYEYNEAMRQIDSITPEMVIQVFDELYPRIKK